MNSTRDGRLWATIAQAHLVEKTDSRWTSDNGGWIGCRNVIRTSSDHGRTWSSPPGEIHVAAPPDTFQVLGSCVYELGDGSYVLLFEPFFRTSLAKMPHEVSLVCSTDRGATWPQKRIIARDQAARLAYFDPRLAQLRDGSWICVYWTHDKIKDESLQTTIAWSPDGYQWSVPQSTPLWGFLTVPIPLSDGRLLAVYNHRREPQGIRLAVSDDAGRSWNMSDEHVLWDQRARAVTGERVSDSIGRLWAGSSMTEMFTWTFGVPHGVELGDSTVLITFYATQGDDRIHQRYALIRVE